jgi:hypothetical protein
MNREQTLRRRIKYLTWLFIVGLVFSGATAIPLQTELRWLVRVTGAEQLTATAPSNAPVWVQWLVRIQGAVEETADKYPTLFYGTDWLAFGHFVIAIAFIGALRDPVRNRWLFDFGLIACALVIPYAFIFGAIRGIPIWWRLIDCSFGVFGFVPLWYCRTWTVEIEQLVSPNTVG